MNLQNDNNNKGFYPMYLGGELGLLDNINETYLDIADMRDEISRNKWHWLEVSLAKDAVDVANPELADGTTAMIRNLSFQYAADSLAATSIIQVMGNFCSNTEHLGLLQEWETSEYIHAMQYSEITKRAFLDPNELLEEIKNTEPLLERLKPLQDIFDETQKMSMLYALGLETDTPRIRKQIFRYHAALLALEGVAFAASFAATFGVAKAYKAYEGIKNSVQLIARDEIDSHVRAGKIVFTNLMREWPEEYEAVKPEIQEIFDTIYELEGMWMNHLFDGIQIRGLNATLLDRYVRYLMGPIYSHLGLSYDYIEEKENPLPWMDEYLNLGDIQVAAQETQLVNYNVNIINDDVHDDYEFEYNP